MELHLAPCFYQRQTYVPSVFNYFVLCKDQGTMSTSGAIGHVVGFTIVDPLSYFLLLQKAMVCTIDYMASDIW